jgi:DNA-binding LytR/AlgR family response regulator
MIAYCTLITTAVTSLQAFFEPEQAEPAPSGDARHPALLGRLPAARRGRLLHLCVRDHYVEVTTDKGTTMVLMRLSDAVRETAPIAGVQVHRSHWVARDAVRRSLREGGRLKIELETGIRVPVSRSFAGDAREAGLIG